MQQYQNEIVFFNWCPPFPAAAPSPDWHVFGNCFTSTTRTVLDNCKGIAKPGNAQFDVCLSALPSADPAAASGVVWVELYAYDAFTKVAAANPQDQPSYRQIGVWPVSVNCQGIAHGGGSLTPAQLAMLQVAAGAMQCSDPTRPVGGITLGVRWHNDPASPNLRANEYSAVLTFGPPA
jgi:hypothetical protein